MIFLTNSSNIKRKTNQKKCLKIRKQNSEKKKKNYLILRNGEVPRAENLVKKRNFTRAIILLTKNGFCQDIILLLHNVNRNNRFHRNTTIGFRIQHVINPLAWSDGVVS